jgi:hypothetical protein
MVGIEERSLSTTSAVKDRERFLAIELGNAVVGWFEALGLCARGEADLLRQAVFDRTTGHRTDGK